MSKPLISICVPVYNVAPYIERCVRSLMEQSYPELEFIFVDDCSGDGSMAELERVLKDYPSGKARALLIYNEHNYGLAYTRRRSIENAHGRYILCVDSDDYIEVDTVQSLVSAAQATGADMVAAGYIHEYQNRQETELPSLGAEETDYIHVALADSLPHLCNKLIARELFTEGKNCYAPEGLDYLEDRMTLFFLLMKAKHVTAIPQATYHYAHRDDSVSQGKNEKHFRCMLRYWEEVDRSLAEAGLTESYKEVVGKQKIADKAFLLMQCDNQTRKAFSDIFREEEKIYRPTLSRGIALMYWLSKHHLWILTYLFECYNRCRHRRQKARS